jgi:hypothetical protein
MTKTVQTRTTTTRAMSARTRAAETPPAEPPGPSTTVQRADDVAVEPQRQSPTSSMRRVRDPTPNISASARQTRRDPRPPSGAEDSLSSMTSDHRSDRRSDHRSDRRSVHSRSERQTGTVNPTPYPWVTGPVWNTGHRDERDTVR